MSLLRLVFWLTLLVAICVWAAAQYIDFSRESNRVTINHVLQEGE